MEACSISSFHGKYRFLSNFYPVSIYFDGNRYDSVEHAYQAAKTLDETERATIQFATTAGQAKKLGKNVTLRSDWHDIKIDIMRDLLVQKFSIPSFRSLLLETDNIRLEEGNNWGDTFWGVCNGKGRNILGKLLMEVREKCKRP